MSQFRADVPDGQNSTAERREVPQYVVMLHRDGDKDLMFIVRCLMELARCSRAEATHQTWQAQHSGQAILLTTYRERAEWFADRCTAKGLTVTVEPLRVKAES